MQRNSCGQWLYVSPKPWQTSRDSLTEWIMANHIQPISQLPQNSSRASPGHLLHWLEEEHLLLPSLSVDLSTEVTRVICLKKKPTRRVRSPQCN